MCFSERWKKTQNYHDLWLWQDTSSPARPLCFPMTVDGGPTSYFPRSLCWTSQTSAKAVQRKKSCLGLRWNCKTAMEKTAKGKKEKLNQIGKKKTWRNFTTPAKNRRYLTKKKMGVEIPFEISTNAIETEGWLLQHSHHPPMPKKPIAPWKSFHLKMVLWRKTPGRENLENPRLNREYVCFEGSIVIVVVALIVIVAVVVILIVIVMAIVI